MKLKTFYVRAAAAAAAALLFLYPFPAHAADSAALQGQVSAGQTVHKGDVIGYVGNTGDVRGANGGYHLHLELRINGTRTDPLQYIPH